MAPELESIAAMRASLKRTRSAEAVVQANPAPLYGTAKKIKTSLLGDDDVDSYNEPHDHFVLCGRGERTNRHPGNKAFRRVVEANRKQYHSGPRRHKILIARSIVEAVYRQDPPGCFVRKDKATGLWVDIGKKEATKKTSQALREESLKDKNTTEESDDHNKDDTESSDGNEEEREEREERENQKPPATQPSQPYGHQQGFVQGAVSFHSSEQGDTSSLDDDFERMMGCLDVLAHDADFAPLHLPNEPATDLSRHSSEGSSDLPLPIALNYHSSIDSGGIISVVSRDSSECDVDISKSIFEESNEFGHMTSIEAV